MRTTPKVFIIAGLFAGAFPNAAPGQFRPPRPDQGPRVLYYEAFPVPLSADSLHERIDVHYRIDREFFVPVRDPEEHSPFHRSGEITVELADSTGGIAARSMRSLDITETDADRKPLGERWEQGIFQLTVPPGKYRIIVSAEDEESRRNILDSSTFVSASPHAGLAGASIVQVVPPRPERPDGSELTLMNYGGEILFGRPASLLVFWRGAPQPGDSLLTVRYAFSEDPPSSVDAPFLPPDGEITVPVSHGMHLEAVSDSAHCGYTLRGTGRASAAVVPLPFARLLLRSFRMTLTLSCGNVKTEIVRKEQAIWPDMPFSLKDIDNALDALRYITTEAELDSLRRGNLESRRSQLEGFWRSKGGKKETAFNDVMTEYYKRVDHATRNFGTMRQPDGFRSDRGRIYVLYGPPTSTDRTLDPVAGFQEVWTYSRLRKKFIFVDQNKSGAYVLVTTMAL